jgi:hemoglobin
MIGLPPNQSIRHQPLTCKIAFAHRETVTDCPDGPVTIPVVMIPTPYDELGGDAVFAPLIEDFYARIAASPIAPLFPPDLAETLKKQAAFQRLFWGGRDDYTPWRGHPRMRARHLPFAIGGAEAEVWLSCMRAAVAGSAMPLPRRERFLERMTHIANAMINQ